MKFTKGFVDMLQPSTLCYNSLDIIIQREDLVLLQLILWFMVACFLTWMLIHFLTYLLVSLQNLSLSVFYFDSTFSRINFGPTKFSYCLSSSRIWNAIDATNNRKKLNFQNKLGCWLIVSFFPHCYCYLMPLVSCFEALRWQWLLSRASRSIACV